MGNCNAHSYFPQVIDEESIDIGLAVKSDLVHEENYENKRFISKLCSHYTANFFRKTVLFF